VTRKNLAVQQSVTWRRCERHENADMERTLFPPVARTLEPANGGASSRGRA